MALDLPRIQALCFDIDGTLADTDDHIVARLAALIDKLPGVSGRRAEKLGRQIVMGLETPVHGAYAWLDRLDLDMPAQRLRERLRAMKQRQADPANTRNPAAIDEVPHDMVPGVQEMLHKLAAHYPMCTISTGGAPRVEKFLEHYGVRDLFRLVVGSQTTRRMKPHPEPLLYAAKAMGTDPRHCVMIGDTTSAAAASPARRRSACCAASARSANCARPVQTSSFERPRTCSPSCGRRRMPWAPAPARRRSGAQSLRASCHSRTRSTCA